jgi:FkbM family methyltransferase
MTQAGLTLHQRASRLGHLFKALTQQHHHELLPMLRPHIPEDGVVIDVGAHAGQFTKLFAGLAARGKVYAFEPGGYARSILERVVRWHRLSHVEIVPMGLSDAEGATELLMPVKASGALGFGLSSLGQHERHGEAVRETITLTTLDAFAAAKGLARLDFLKADIEGWEARLLMGGRETLARLRPALYLEVDDRTLARAGDTAGAVWDLLTPIGYTAAKVSEDGTVARVTAYEGSGNYLFTAR